jgi:outer membrane protein, heavy metal efflux system
MRVTAHQFLPLGAALLAACAQFEEKPLSAEATGAAFSERSLSDPGLLCFLKQEGASSGAWSLDQLALAGVYFHGDVALAIAEADEVSAAITTARQRPNPVFTFAPQWTGSPLAFTPWFFLTSIAIPIETAHKRSYRIEQAEALADASRWRVSARAWTARSRVRAAMLECYGAKENTRLLQREESLNQDVITKLEAQMEVGDISPPEISQARLMLNRTRLSLQDARRLGTMAEARLAAAVGIPLPELAAAALDFSAFERLPGTISSQIRRVALTQRADLIALLDEYVAAESALKLELAKQYPDLMLQPGYDYNSGQNRWQLHFVFTIPLNQNRGPIAQAEAKRVTAEKRFLAHQNQIEGEIDIALAGYEASRAKARVAGQLAAESAAATDATQRRIEAGELSSIELVRRQLEASTAGAAVISAKIEAQMAAGALEDAIHAPLR